MTSVIVEDRGGVKLNAGIDVGGFVIPVLMASLEETEEIFHKLKDLEFRDDDIMLCTYQKTGTNWLYEVLSMINNRSAERVKTNKVMTMIEAAPQERMNQYPSPRVLNSHLPLRYLPEDMKKKKIKTVLCFRNPKDTVVSFYNHQKGIKKFEYDGKFSDWLPVYLEGKLTYGKYSDYLKEWENAIKEGVDFPLLTLYYEDIKLNGAKELDRLLQFLGVDLDEQLKKDILDACSFERMSKEKMLGPKHLVEKAFHQGFNFFRKGEIGDWKNWFTVAESEMFDEIWSREMKDSEMFNFKYSS